jgi:hypothetical protein
MSCHCSVRDAVWARFGECGPPHIARRGSPDGGGSPTEHLCEAAHEAVTLRAEHAVQAAPSICLGGRRRLQAQHDAHLRL